LRYSEKTKKDDGCEEDLEVGGRKNVGLAAQH
jgi:hypothetical protein